MLNTKFHNWKIVIRQKIKQRASMMKRGKVRSINDWVAQSLDKFSLMLIPSANLTALHDCPVQKYSRLRCLLCVKGLVICFYLGWSGSILQFRQNIIKVGSKSWLLTRRSNITLILLSYTGSVLKRELNLCHGYLRLLNSVIFALFILNIKRFY